MLWLGVQDMHWLGNTAEKDVQVARKKGRGGGGGNWGNARKKTFFFQEEFPNILCTKYLMENVIFQILFLLISGI